MANKKKRAIIAISVILLLILLTPFPASASDGGTVRYSAIIYTITNYRRFWYEDGHHGFLVGIHIEVFNRTVFNNVRFEW